jgi:3-hydroxyacyl-CoA dehydrogenase
MGQKSGAGFRRYHGNAPSPVADPDFDAVLRSSQDGLQKGEPAPDESQISDRLFLPMLLEAVRAVEDGIVNAPADVDVAVRMGLGFPAALGGLFHWCDGDGAPAIVNRAARYESLGPAFHVPALLAEAAATRANFLC